MAKLEERRYTLNELSAILREEKEYKPVMFNSENKKENKEADDAMMKAAEEQYGGKIPEKKLTEEDTLDLNKTTLDANFTIEPGKEWKEKVKAQAEGYDSALQKENHKGKENKDEKAARESGKKFYDSREKQSKETSKKVEANAAAGLKAREIAKDMPDFYKPKTAFGESKTMKRLRFKNTVFLSEDKIRSLIPEDYKKDGNKFFMTDANDNDYIVECKEDKAFGYVTVEISKHQSDNEINEELERMKQLAGYDSKNFNKPNRADNLRKDLDIMRKLDKVEI